MEPASAQGLADVALASAAAAAYTSPTKRLVKSETSTPSPMNFQPTAPPPRSQPPGLADMYSTMMKMQQKMDDMEKDLLEVRQENKEVRQENKKWKAVDKKWKSDVGDEQEQEQEQEQTQEYYMGSEASLKKSAHAREAAQPFQPGEPPSPGMAQQQPWSQESDPWQTEARKTWLQQGLKQGWTSTDQENHHKDLKPPVAYGGNIDKWKEWSKSFMRYLKRRDRRWPDLLEKVQELKGKPVTSEDENKWAWELYIYIYIYMT